ncbi:hypothetical protein BDM02DRAFT_3067950, partial [Thelephora ganbajun]
SILPASASQGMIALEIFEGSVTKDCFMRFLGENIAPQLNPFLGKHSIIVMDKRSIHHERAIEDLIEGE